MTRPSPSTTTIGPAAGIARFLCGTPSVLGMAALERGLAPFGAVDPAALFAKASALGALYIRLMERALRRFRLHARLAARRCARGGHVSYAHDHAYPICQALIARGVVGDFRAPDTLRMGFAPLYTRYEDVWRAVETIRDVMASRAWDDEVFRIAREGHLIVLSRERRPLPAVQNSDQKRSP